MNINFQLGVTHTHTESYNSLNHKTLFVASKTDEHFIYFIVHLLVVFRDPGTITAIENCNKKYCLKEMIKNRDKREVPVDLSSLYDEYYTILSTTVTNFHFIELMTTWYMSL